MGPLIFSATIIPGAVSVWPLTVKQVTNPSSEVFVTNPNSFIILQWTGCRRYAAQAKVLQSWSQSRSFRHSGTQINSHLLSSQHANSDLPAGPVAPVPAEAHITNDILTAVPECFTQSVLTLNGMDVMTSLWKAKKRRKKHDPQEVHRLKEQSSHYYVAIKLCGGHNKDKNWGGKHSERTHVQTLFTRPTIKSVVTKLLSDRVN